MNKVIKSKILLSVLSLIMSSGAISSDADISAVEFIQYLSSSSQCSEVMNKKNMTVTIDKDRGVFNAMPLYCYYLNQHPEKDVKKIVPDDIGKINAWLVSNSVKINTHYLRNDLGMPKYKF